MERLFRVTVISVGTSVPLGMLQKARGQDTGLSTVGATEPLETNEQAGHQRKDGGQRTGPPW